MSSHPFKSPGSGVPLLVLVVLAFSVASGVAVPEVLADTPCILIITDTQVTDNGDGDGFADTNETLQIGFTVESRCAIGPKNCVARLYTDSPAIDCSRQQEFLVGNLPLTPPAVTPPETFEIKIGEIDRDDLGLGPDDALELSFFLDLKCDWHYEGDYGSYVGTGHSFAIPLDLNVSDLGQTPVPWSEDFESGTLGRFEPQNNDAGMPGRNHEEGRANADGWRCHFCDPDWINSETYNYWTGESCYPGMNLAQADAIFWQIDGEDVAASPDGGRAKSGSYSMYYGVFLDQPDTDLFSTPVGVVEAVGTTDPINLGAQSPKLRFWHQISLLDGRTLQPHWDCKAFDRGVVQIQLTDATDTHRGYWTNVQPAKNSYVVTTAENHWRCMFDPVDDGNTEDDFWDPTDPLRESGPSSTCPGVRTWSHQGDTSPTPFDAANIGYASTPPATSDSPALGSGTWVQAEFDLTPYRGRPARLRFLVSAMKEPFAGETHRDWLDDIGDGDDGWWIDDIVIDETLNEPAVFSNDAFLLGSCSGNGEPCIGQCRLSLVPCSVSSPCGEGEGDCVSPCPLGEVCSGPPPDCGENCTLAEANIFILPDGPANPASVTTTEPDELVDVHLAGAEPSWVDVCIDGIQEYRSCISGDPDGDGPGMPDSDCGDPWDIPPDSDYWSMNGRKWLSPEFDTTYALEVRCSSAPDCRDGRTLEVIVQCPSRNPNTLGLQEVRALDRETLTWRGALDVDWLRGSFSNGTDIGDYSADFTGTRVDSISIPMDGDPPAASGHYYLVKRDGAIPPSIGPFEYRCDSVTWRSGGNGETSEPARDDGFGNP